MMRPVRSSARDPFEERSSERECLDIFADISDRRREYSQYIDKQIRLASPLPPRILASDRAAEVQCA